jgi:hypothetical protein
LQNIIISFYVFKYEGGALRMRYFKMIGLAVAFCMVLILSNAFVCQAYEDTQCFQCHTSAKKLIEATREIAKLRPAVKSAETSGEG